MTTKSDEKLKKLALLRKKTELMDSLPHLYGQKLYSWQRKFLESTARFNFLCAANQIGKSSIQIIRAIHWATEPSLWPKLWRHRPLQLWYLLPTREISTIELEKKWIPQYLPRGAMKDHPQYGWKHEYKNKFIWAIHFNTGVSIYFKTYATDVQHLQSGSVDAIFCDEELPAELYPELVMRLAGTWGYFHMVFTATMAQPFWFDVIERQGQKGERLTEDSLKIQVSMYDCLEFEDGTPSHWTPERIEKVKNSCQSDAEVKKRVYGRFVAAENRIYPSFSRDRNVKAPHPLPPSWHVYAGVDIGSGGESGHPASIVFVAVSPDFRQGRVFKGWRGDGVQTTASDILEKFIEMKGKMVLSGQFYDWAAKDFETIAHRMGEPFQPADKSHERGEQILNVLFKNEMLAIYDSEELAGLVDEIGSLLHSVDKRKAKDDFTDALRYAVSKVPWAWDAIGGIPIQMPTVDRVYTSDEMRRGIPELEDTGMDAIFEQEINEWAELYEP